MRVATDRQSTKRVCFLASALLQPETAEEVRGQERTVKSLRRDQACTRASDAPLSTRHTWHRSPPHHSARQHTADVGVRDSCRERGGGEGPRTKMATYVTGVMVVSCCTTSSSAVIPTANLSRAHQGSGRQPVLIDGQIRNPPSRAHDWHTLSVVCRLETPILPLPALHRPSHHRMPLHGRVRAHSVVDSEPTAGEFCKMSPASTSTPCMRRPAQSRSPQRSVRRIRDEG
jgi:hypothetical protein